MNMHPDKLKSKRGFCQYLEDKAAVSSYWRLHEIKESTFGSKERVQATPLRKVGEIYYQIIISCTIIG